LASAAMIWAGNIATHMKVTASKIQIPFLISVELLSPC
jgi:hypothetical protein